MSKYIFDRVEKKYVLSKEQYEKIIKKLEGKMELDKYGFSTNSAMGGREGKDHFNPTSTDNKQKLTINDGNIHVNSEEDGIDINGSGYINGGIITVDGPMSSGNGALDYDGELVMTNGTLIACGSSGMMQTVSNNSTIYCLSIIFSQNQSAGSEIKVVDKNNDVIIKYAPNKQYQSAVICSPNLNKNEEYSIYVNETKIDTITIENIITNIGNMGMNNMRPNGGEKMPNGDMQKPDGTIQKFR